MMDNMRHYIVGPWYDFTDTVIGAEAYYKMNNNCAKKYANQHNLELAEGPTYLVKDNSFYGPVELWPLVHEEGVD